MSIAKIEYPTLDSTRVAAMITHGEIIEQATNHGIVFFKATRNGVPNVEAVGLWSFQGNYGIVYNHKEEA